MNPTRPRSIVNLLALVDISLLTLKLVMIHVSTKCSYSDITLLDLVDGESKQNHSKIKSIMIHVTNFPTRHR